MLARRHCALLFVALAASVGVQDATTDPSRTSTGAGDEYEGLGTSSEHLPAPTPPETPHHHKLTFSPPPPSPLSSPEESNAATAGPVHRVTDGGGGGEGSSSSSQSDGDVEEEGECWADDKECVEGEQQCQWWSDLGALYNLDDFSDQVFQTAVHNLKGSSLQFTLCSSAINCNGRQSPTCLSVPGVKLTSTGTIASFEPLEPNVPGKGFKLVFLDGDLCELTNKPRVMTVSLPCGPNTHYKPGQIKPSRASEGSKESVCRYTVDFPASRFGCPLDGQAEEGDRPILTAVQGCVDSLPLHTTEDCHYAGHVQLSLHGLNLHLLCPEQSSSSSQHNSPPHFSTSHCTNHVRSHYTVYIGPFQCRHPIILSKYTLNCTMDRGNGNNLDIVVYRNTDKSSGSGDEGEEGREAVMILEGAVSFKEAIDFREKFSKFPELGVGGLKREIDELYRRAFASRGVSQEVLKSMGITHVKGILLYGPPGSGKTLVARTIAKILGSKQVQLINGPEIISKYLGESERNLRAHFEAAHKAWKEHGHLSELFVIIIDEIDAICKPRGKTDQSAAGVAYDALVNQLLTLMDGLNEAYNTLVIGLTNRRELMDPALLRPGRFEVQIEMGLPDEEGREEIFLIHTRSMLAGGMLAHDVDMTRLAASTSRFSGAEIAGVVRAASSYALERYQSDSSEESVVVTGEDFYLAIRTMDPAYTHSESQVLSRYLPNGYLSCGEAHDRVIELSLDLLYMLKQSSSSQLQTLLLYGPRGSGKTTLAAHLAVLGKFSFVKVLTASSVVGQSTLGKMEAIHRAFTDAFSSDLAMVVLDDLHRLVEYMKVGPQLTVSHDLLHTVTTLLTSTIPAGVKMLVVGTLTVEDGVGLDDPQFVGLPDLFLQHHYVPLLDCDAALTFLNASNIHRFGSGQFSLPSNLEISVRQLQHAIECACAQGSCSAHRSQPSVVRQDHLLDCIMAYVTRQMAELETELG